MEQTHDDQGEPAAPVPGVLTLGSGTKSLEVRADGIYATSNQVESKVEAASPDLALASPKEVGEEEPASSAVSPVTESQASEQESPNDVADVESLQPATLAAQASGEEDFVDGTREIASPTSAPSEPSPLPVDATPSAPRDSSPRTLDTVASPSNASTSQDEDLRRSDRKHHDDVASEDTLHEVQAYLVSKIQENQLSSHAQQVHAFVAQHMSESQQRRQLPALVQRVVEHFSADAQARGEADVSVDVQSGICLLEHMFLNVGRVSPLQDMYTAEEEAMLDALALHSGRSDSGNANA